MLLVVKGMLRFIGAAHHIPCSDSGLLIGGYAAEKNRGIGRGSMPYLTLDEAPPNIETIFARTMLAVRSNLNLRHHGLQSAVGNSVELSRISSKAWRFDDVLSQQYQKNLWLTQPKMALSTRSSTLYDGDPPFDPSKFGSVLDHMNSDTNRAFTDSLVTFFSTKGAGTRFANQSMI